MSNNICYKCKEIWITKQKPCRIFAFLRALPKAVWCAVGLADWYAHEHCWNQMPWTARGHEHRWNKSNKANNEGCEETNIILKSCFCLLNLGIVPCRESPPLQPYCCHTRRVKLEYASELPESRLKTAWRMDRGMLLPTFTYFPLRGYSASVLVYTLGRTSRLQLQNIYLIICFIPWKPRRWCKHQWCAQSWLVWGNSQ